MKHVLSFPFVVQLAQENQSPNWDKMKFQLIIRNAMRHGDNRARNISRDTKTVSLCAKLCKSYVEATRLVRMFISYYDRMRALFKESPTVMQLESPFGKLTSFLITSR